MDRHMSGYTFTGIVFCGMNFRFSFLWPLSHYIRIKYHWHFKLSPVCTNFVKKESTLQFNIPSCYILCPCHFNRINNSHFEGLGRSYSVWCKALSGLGHGVCTWMCYDGLLPGKGQWRVFRVELHRPHQQRRLTGERTTQRTVDTSHIRYIKKIIQSNLLMTSLCHRSMYMYPEGTCSRFISIMTNVSKAPFSSLHVQWLLFFYSALGISVKV